MSCAVIVAVSSTSPRTTGVIVGNGLDIFDETIPTLPDEPTAFLINNYGGAENIVLGEVLVLHVRGNAALLANLSVAVVGSRRATPYAARTTEGNRSRRARIRPSSTDAKYSATISLVTSGVRSVFS